MSEIADLYKKITDAQKGLKTNKDIPAADKADVKKWLDYLESNFAGLPKKRDDLLTCILELATLDKDIAEFNKKFGGIFKYANGLAKRLSSIKTKAKSVTDLQEAAAGIVAIPELSRNSKV